jgi:hypothetical protein
LHKSDQNLGHQRRWSIICSYNRADNDPVIEHHHPRYHKLEKGDDDELMSCENKVSNVDKWYFKPDAQLKN